jgi:molecular chaperone DnaK (HSP70)
LRVEPQPAGLPRIEITFLLDANGILNVSAKDLRTGQAQSIQVTPSYGLTEGEVEKMVEESFEFAESDVRSRLLIDARNEADIILRAVEKALKQGDHLLSQEERRSIETSLQALKMAKEKESHLPIVEALEGVEKATGNLANRLMDQTVKQVLQNRKMKDVLKEFGPAPKK